MSAARSPKRLAIGLTGGIGSGKTTVSDLFQHLGVDVIDADVVARQLVSKGSPLLDQICRQFGAGIRNRDGDLDRLALREKIFHDPDSRQWLEALLHPAIREEIRKRVQASTTPYAIVVIPLLVESGHYDFLDRIAVVDVPEAVQVDRTMARDNVSRELAQNILASQTSRQARLALADDIIDNNGSRENLQQRVTALHEQYLRLASGDQ